MAFKWRAGVLFLLLIRNRRETWPLENDEFWKGCYAAILGGDLDRPDQALPSLPLQRYATFINIFKNSRVDRWTLQFCSVLGLSVNVSPGNPFSSFIKTYGFEQDFLSCQEKLWGCLRPSDEMHHPGPAHSTLGTDTDLNLPKRFLAAPSLPCIGLLLDKSKSFTGSMFRRAGLLKAIVSIWHFNFLLMGFSLLMVLHLSCLPVMILKWQGPLMAKLLCIPFPES